MVARERQPCLIRTRSPAARTRPRRIPAQITPPCFVIPPAAWLRTPRYVVNDLIGVTELKFFESLVVAIWEHVRDGELKNRNDEFE
jgi:hypothetical protein